MVNGGTTMDFLSEMDDYSYAVGILRVKANSVLCVQCDMWIHGRCAWMNGVI